MSFTDSISITEFGATPDALATEAIQKAIDAVAQKGGGTVLIPPGVWTSGTIYLKTGITLFLPPSATLRASPDLAHYPNLATGHNKDRQPFHLLMIDRQHHITITGGGTIDGQGLEFWNPPQPPSPWYREKKQRVSPLFECWTSQHIILQDITFKDSPGWTVHFFNSDHITLRGVTVDNHLYGPNTDGFDINGCRDVFITDCHLSCGDDAIIIKSTDDARSCERIVITNCIVRSNCIGIGLGCEAENDIRQVTISNCVAFNSMRMFAIGVWNGGVVEDVTVNNMVGDTIVDLGTDRPIHLDVKRLRDDSGLGALRNVQISNFIARTCGRALLTAEDGAWLENVTLRDVHLIYPSVEDPAVTIPRSTSVQLSNRSPEARVAHAALVVENAKNLQVHNFVATWPEANSVASSMHGMWGKNIRGGIINTPLLRASDDQTEIFRWEKSDARVV